jgi:hypothetical protein
MSKAELCIQRDFKQELGNLKEGSAAAPGGAWISR